MFSVFLDRNYAQRPVDCVQRLYTYKLSFGPLLCPFYKETHSKGTQTKHVVVLQTESTTFHFSTVEHDFNGHEVNGINEVNGKKCQDSAFHFVNKLHDFYRNS